MASTASKASSTAPKAVRTRVAAHRERYHGVDVRILSVDQSKVVALLTTSALDLAGGGRGRVVVGCMHDDIPRRRREERVQAE